MYICVDGGFMKSLGITRTLDKEGRYSIPKELTSVLNIEAGDKVIIQLVDDAIRIIKVEEKCIFCKSDETLFEIGNKKICESCLSDL